MQPAFCISIQSQHKLKFILSDNHADISRNKAAKAKVLEFIDHPPIILINAGCLLELLGYLNYLQIKIKNTRNGIKIK